MAEVTKDTASELDKQVKEMAEQSPTIAPIVEMQAKILNRVETVAGDAETARERTVGEMKEFEQKVEKGFADAADRFDRLSERFSAIPSIGGGVKDREAALAKAVEPQNKVWAPHLMNFCKSAFNEGEVLRDPMHASLLNEWFYLSTLVQRPKMYARHKSAHERLEVLEKAFADARDPLVKLDGEKQLNIGTPSDGGYLVPTIVEGEILRLIQDAGLIFPRCRQWPMSTTEHQIPDEATAVTVSWVDEANPLPGGEPTFGQKKLTAEKISGRATMSEEVVMDSNTPILPFLLTTFTEQMARELDRQVVEGDGATTPPTSITGIVNDADVNEVQADGAGAAGGDLSWTGNGIVETYVAGREEDSRSNGLWICGPAIWGKLLGLSDSQGLPIYQTGILHLSGRRQLLGHDIVVHAGLDEAINVGPDVTGNLYFGNATKLSFGTRMGMRWDVTDQVNWSTNQIDARLLGRFAFVVGVPKAWTKLTGINSD